MRVRFLANYDYTPSAERRTTFAYFAGQEETVKRECGLAAIKAGAAVEIESAARVAELDPSEAELLETRKFSPEEIAAPSKKPLSPAQIKALDGDGNGGAGGSLPKDKA